MHLHLFDHPRHRLEEHHHSCLGLKNVLVSMAKPSFSSEEAEEKIYFNLPRDSSKNVTAFPLSQSITGRISKTFLTHKIQIKTVEIYSNLFC